MPRRHIQLARQKRGTRPWITAAAQPRIIKRTADRAISEGIPPAGSHPRHPRSLYFSNIFTRISRFEYNARRLLAVGQTVMRVSHTTLIQGCAWSSDPAEVQIIWEFSGWIRLFVPCHKTVTFLHPNRHTTAAQCAPTSVVRHGVYGVVFTHRHLKNYRNLK